MNGLEAIDRRQGANACQGYRHRGLDRTILLLSDDAEDLEEWAVSTSTTELLGTVRSKGTREDLRIAVLGELMDREEPAMARFVVESLDRPEESASWRNALLRATPRIQVTDDSLRVSLSKSLWRYALALKHAQTNEEESLLWTAIRRYATLRPQADIGKLVEFLDEPSSSEGLPRLHVVLLAIQNAFYAWAPTEAEAADLEELRRCVSDLGARYLTCEVLDTADKRAIALASYCAAATLGCSDLPALTERVLALGQSWLIELAEKKLAPLLDRWRDREDGVGSWAIHDLLRRAIDELAVTISRDSKV